MAVIFPIIVLAGLFMFYLNYRKYSRPLASSHEWIYEVLKNHRDKPRITFIATRHPMEKRDILPLSVILAVFAFLALFRLGDTSAPQSFHHFSQSRNRVQFELDSPEEISRLMYYTGLWTGHYTLEFSEDGRTWQEQNPFPAYREGETPTPAMNQPHAHLFKWQLANINSDNPPTRYIRLTASRTPMELGEIALFDAGGAIIPGSRIISENVPELFDEQHLVPERQTYMNSMYFDEIYHGRTAYEHQQNIYPYETTHPPLGKEIISASIGIFGMTPFGWRFAGALFGVLMLAVMYLLIKNMFGKTIVATCATLLFGFDFMRFVQTRIATIDTYGVFFILLSFFFMYRYITTPPDAKFRRSLLPLALSGISFGFGIASKWIVPYAGLGLAVIYALRLIHLRRHYKNSEKTGFAGYVTATISFSVLFFVVIPAIIYYLTYIPYGLAGGMTVEGGMLWDPAFYHDIVWKNQVYMFEYHGFLVDTHPYSSQWWQWIINARPILYVRDSIDSLRHSAFAAFGNPVVWWGGFIAMIFAAIDLIKKRDGKLLFILIGYLSQLLPWVVISRIVFIYHYFPSTLFLVLALAYVFNSLLERERGSNKIAVYGFTGAAGAVFVMFYPALTGIYVPRIYFTNFLRWIPTMWPF